MAILDISNLIPSVLIIGMWSYLFWGDSWVYDIIQDLAAATAIGYQAILAYETFLRVGVTPLIEGGTTHLIIPIGLGLLVFAVASRKWTWTSRWPMSIMIGVGLGLSMASYAYSDIYMQITQSWVLGIGQWESIIIVLGMTLPIWYFVYTVPHKLKGGGGVAPMILDRLADVGKAFVMIYISSKWAGAVLMRMSITLSNVMRILWDWLGLGPGKLLG